MNVPPSGTKPVEPDQAREARLNAFFHHSVDAILFVDHHMTIVDANQAAASLSGYPLTELIGTQVGMLLPESLAKLIPERFPEFLAKGHMRGQYELIRKDGVPVDVEFNAAADVAPGLHIAILRDVSERRAAERELKVRAHQQQTVAGLGRRALSSEDVEHLFTDAAAAVAEELGVDEVMVLELQRDGNGLRVSAATGRLPGAAGTAGGGRSSLAGFAIMCDESVVVDDLTTEERFDRQHLLLEHGVRSSACAIIRGPAGAVGVLEAHSIRLRAFTEDDVSFLRGVANVLGAAVERRRINERLLSEEHAHREMFERAPMGILRSSLDGRILLANEAAAHLLHYESAEALMSLGETRSLWAEPPQRNAIVDEVLRTGSMETEVEAIRADGTHAWMLVNFHGVTDDEGNLTSIESYFHDATERHRAHEQLQHTIEERRQWLERLARVNEEERARLSRELHDHLGQLLTSAALYAKSLEDEVPAAQAEDAHGVRRLVEQAIGATRNLAWSVRAGNLQARGLETEVRRLADEFSSHHGLRVDVHANGLADHLPPVIELTAYRVIQEALTNAARHAAAKAISIVLVRRGHELEIVVEDDGRGFSMPPSQDDRAPGLGIRSMRERAESTGGRLDIESTAGMGTTVRLRLPVNGSP